MRTRTLLRGGVAVTLVALVMSTMQSSRADDMYPGQGLSPYADSAGWANTAQAGLSYAKRAKQWFRPPAGMVTSTIDYGQVVKLGDGLYERKYVSGEGYFVSPEGAPANYGYLEPMTVRSVGFGLMPVEATVQVSQRREDGYPVPVTARPEIEYFYERDELNGNRTAYREDVPETIIKDAFNVEILSVKVDGVDLSLTGGCRTVEPAPVTLVGPAYSIPYPTRYPGYEEYWFKTHDPTTWFHPYYGGQLSGEITIPPFTGCTTAAGDDLSKLMTLSVSGPGNPIKAAVGWPCAIEVDGTPWPAAPGQSNPKLAGCPGAKPFEYPARDGG